MTTANAVTFGVGDSVTLFSAKNQSAINIGKSITTYQWDLTEVKISILGGKAQINEQYSTEINWSLVSEATQ